ncbi:sensor histidine kinase [Haloarcula salina]|uniref:sensor histidine kinase n=1 Tax=Haloarcula salina TaxID=1429914 RepID=UPI003C6FC49E
MLSVAPFALSIVLVALWFERAALSPTQYPRILAWFAGGLGSFLLLNLAMMVAWPSGTFGGDLGWALFAAAVGGAGGLAIGVFEARAIARAVDAERHRLQRTAVEERNERLNEFASLVAHDLRNPLEVASGNVELARQEHDSPRLETTAAALDRMGTIIDQTLLLARTGHVISDTEAVDLRELVDQSWQSVPTGDATLRNEVTDTIEADPDRLRHLFENLFRNSVEHGSAGSQNVNDDCTGDLTVRVSSMDGGFYVADDGPGIPPEKREAVLQDSYSTADGGGGLGLAIVQRIVDAHGWELAVTESDEGGTRFEVTGVDSRTEAAVADAEAALGA